ncbi:hypothetical protein IFHNHDMJ_00525 [Synechococcus sp. CBW1107]|nr:hypothetical protein IFHNHDMJ_00525 [Synechococcus sp. CBW1107]
MPEASPLPALSGGRIIFGSLNHLQMLNPAMVAVLRRLLLQCKSCTLLRYRQVTDPCWRGRWEKLRGLRACLGCC